MKELISKKLASEIVRSVLGFVLIAAAGGYLTYMYITLKVENAVLTERIDTAKTALAVLQAKNSTVSKQLDKSETDVKDLQSIVGGLSGTVDVLQKYAKTDKQLLEKYSKVYFLNENYIPESLTAIDSSYLFEKNKDVEFHTNAYPFLKNMLNGAKASGLNILVASAYRSFGTQSSLKSSYKKTFGTTAANSFSADQGYSEHQLGTAADLTTPSVGGGLNGFEKTPEYTWLQNNAYRYGFILSYPANNAYYIFEPWHWRFVGIALATRLHNDKKHFYDLDQRDINDYLVKIFDLNN
jgi:LAS superfamily LD-carboxypeptidase LdcB